MANSLFKRKVISMTKKLKMRVALIETQIVPPAQKVALVAAQSGSLLEGRIELHFTPLEDFELGDGYFVDITKFEPTP